MNFMMNFLILLLLPMAIPAFSLDRRQQSAAQGSVSGVFDSRTLQPKLRTEAKRTVTRFGPLILKPGGQGRTGFSMDANGQSFTVRIPKGAFCTSCTVLAGRVGVEFEDGTQADVGRGVYTHHILSQNSKKRVQPFINTCDTQGEVANVKVPTNTIATGFVGVSDDNGNEPVYYTTKDGKFESGYHISEDESFSAMVDLVNYSKEQKKIFLSYDLEYLQGKVGANSAGSLLSVTGCMSRSIKTSTTKPTNTTSGKFAFYHDGHIVNSKGHLHDGGVQMDMFINGKYICSSKAIYGGDNGTMKDKEGKVWETISEMSICSGPIAVKKGDYLSMNAQYDLTKHPLRQTSTGGMSEVMGMWSIIFAIAKT